MLETCDTFGLQLPGKRVKIKKNKLTVFEQFCLLLTTTLSFDVMESFHSVTSHLMM